MLQDPYELRVPVGGHRLEVPATRRNLRSMFPEAVHTSSVRGRRSKLNSRTDTGFVSHPERPYRRQPPKSQVFTTIFDFVALGIGPVEAACQGRFHVSRKKLAAARRRCKRAHAAKHCRPSRAPARSRATHRYASREHAYSRGETPLRTVRTRPLTTRDGVCAARVAVRSPCATLQRAALSRVLA